MTSDFKKWANKLADTLLVELDLLLELKGNMRHRMIITLMGLVAIPFLLGYLAFDPYILPEKKPILVGGIVAFFLLIISPLAIMNTMGKLLRRYRLTTAATLFGCIIGAALLVVQLLEQFGPLSPYYPPYLSILVPLAAVILVSGVWELEKILKEMSSEKARVETEIRLARDIQHKLLPMVHERRAQYHLYGLNRAANEVGGDYFDTRLLPDGRLALAVGDVSGHNVAAGLTMAMTKAAVQTEWRYLSSGKCMLSSLNQTVRDHTDRKTFVSLICGFLDFEKQSLELLNGGHLPPLHYHASTGEVEEVKASGGTALGISEQMRVGKAEVPFVGGDRFLFFTDGLTEACDDQGKMFGLADLTRLFAAWQHPEDFMKALWNELAPFGDLEDDITLLWIAIE